MPDDRPVESYGAHKQLKLECDAYKKQAVEALGILDDIEKNPRVMAMLERYAPNTAKRVKAFIQEYP
jgi:hypothetical protein